jgi:pimeloyl-ACP methyl ester carboxylesterase
MATFVLVPGMWLGAWAWRDVTRALRDLGHEVHPLTLTGVADRAHLSGPDVDLDTHIEDIVQLIEVEDLRDVVLVGHSYGGLPVSAAALRLSGRLAMVVYVDSGPLPEGTTQLSMADEHSPVPDGGAVPPRDWDPDADPAGLAGLDETALTLLRTRSTPHPRGSVAAPLGRRATAADVRTALVACLFGVDQVQAMIAEGHPFFAALAGAEVVGLRTGHWPMLSEPDALAGVLDGLTHPRSPVGERASVSV